MSLRVDYVTDGQHGERGLENSSGGQETSD